MSDTVLIALIGLAGSAVGSLAGILISSKLTQYRLEQLEKKVDGFAEKQTVLESRVYALEKHNEVQDERQRIIDRRIGGLEKRVET